MTMDQTQMSQDLEPKQERLALPRRGFLQKCAFATGAFVTGVFRLDQNFADTSKSIKHYCCHLVKPKADCVLADCKSQFYWICSWKDSDGVPYLIRCVECFNIEISSEGKREVEQGWTEIENHYEHLRCSKALHPDDHDFTEF